MEQTDDKKLEYIILYIISGCMAVIIGALTRLSTLQLGFDSFSANIVFVVAIAISVAVFLSIQLTLKNLMIPWIERWLLKIPYIKNKVKRSQPIDEMPENIVQQPILSLDDIRNEQLQNKAKEQEEKLNIALNYTRKMFAPYVSDEHVELLCSNVKIYANKLSLAALCPVKTSKKLANIDVSHFGWNIWNYFRVGQQIDIAYFLKKIFPDILKDVDIETIKRHLKDDDLKGFIKIHENISEHQ